MESKPFLLLKNKKTGHLERYTLDQEHVGLGRDRSNYVCLEDKTVSRKHASITLEGSQFFLQDLGSNNGTLLNNRKLHPQEKKLLQPSDVIQIDDYELTFQLPSAGDQKDLYEITDTDILEIKMVKKLLKAMDKEQAPSLEVIDGPHVGTRYVLEGKNQEITIGRDPACEFCIDSDVVSRKHVKIVKRWDNVRLIDLGSKNGSYVNKGQIKEKQLQDGDIIHLGTLGLVFHNPQELSLEIVAPPPPKTVEEKTGPEIAVEPEPSTSRAVRKRDPDALEPADHESISAQAVDEQKEEAQEPPEVTARRFQLGWVEILFGIIGLGVIGLSLWGIWTLLKP